MVLQQAQARSTTDTETRSSPQSPLSFIPTSGFETSHTVHSYPRSIQIIGDIETPSLLSNPNTADLPYHTLDENSRPPTPEHYNYPLLLDNQIIYHPRQDQRYRILPVNRITNSHQYVTSYPSKRTE